MSCGGGCHPAARSAFTHSNAISFVTTPLSPIMPELTKPPRVGRLPMARGNGDTITLHLSPGPGHWFPVQLSSSTFDG
jgi:hypothetical protein